MNQILGFAFLAVALTDAVVGFLVVAPRVASRPQRKVVLGVMTASAVAMAVLGALFLAGVIGAGTD